MNGTVKNIALKDIVLSKDNPRDASHRKNGSLKELADSIKRLGVRVPVQLRKVNDKYQIVAGERRVSACRKLKLKDIPAIVLEKASDAFAFETTLAENESRIDLGPIEQAEGIKTLLAKHNGDVKAVSERTGISPANVRAYRAIDNLCDEWKKFVAEDIDEDIAFSSGILACIARMPKDIQVDILDRAYQISSMNVDQFNDWIEEYYLHVIDHAKFDTADCLECEKRTTSATQEDFWDLEDSKKNVQPMRRLDWRCWQEKHLAYVEKLIADNLAEHKGLRLRVVEKSGSTSFYAALKKRYGDRTVIRQTYDFDKAKKSDKQAIPVLWVEGVNTGKIHYLKPKRTTSAPTTSAEKKPSTLKERRLKLKGLRLQIVIKKLEDALEKAERPLKCTLDVLVRYVVANGSSITNVGLDAFDVWDFAFGKKQKVPFADSWNGDPVDTDMAEVLWQTVRGDLGRRITSIDGGRGGLNSEAAGRDIAELINFDFEAAFKEACEQKPEPKSWANLKADGTPK